MGNCTNPTSSQEARAMLGSGNMMESLNIRRTGATMASTIHSGIHLGLHVYTKLTDALVSLYEKQQ
jgi:hypothetical protein